MRYRPCLLLCMCTFRILPKDATVRTICGSLVLARAAADGACTTATCKCQQHTPHLPDTWMDCQECLHNKQLWLFLQAAVLSTGIQVHAMTRYAFMQ